MKSVLLSIKPKYCELIAGGIKTIEVRKTKPKLDTPFKCYIYCTKGKNISFWTGKRYSYADDRSHNLFDVCGNGKVIGEFICSKITEFESEFWDDETYERIQTIIKDCERYFESGEYEYETVATNEDEKYKENWLCKQSCVSWEEMRKYVGTGIKEFYGWHISDLKIYDTPKELSEFYVEDKASIKQCKHRFCTGQPERVTQNGGWLKGGWGCTKDGYPTWCENCLSKPLNKPPQSWCYVEEVTE